MTRTVSRVFKSGPSTWADFLSDEAKGKPRPSSPGRLRLYDGLSVYATLSRARRKARGFPMLGNFLAEGRIPDDAPVRVERTMLGSAGHHTLWAEPDVLLGCVSGMVSVR